MKTILQREINKLSRILKFDANYYLKNSFWLGSSQIVTALLSLATMSAMGYFLPKEVFGEYRYLISLASVIGIFYLSGYSTTITQQIAKGNLGFYLSASKNVFYSSFAGTIIAMCLSAYYLYNNNFVLGIGLIFIGLATPFINNYLLANSFFSGLKEFKKTATLVLIPDILSTLFLVGVSIFTNSVILLLFIYLFTNLIGNFYIHRKIINREDLRNQNSTETFLNWLRKLDKNSIHYSIINLIGVISINLDKLLIFTIIGSKELAIFFFAQAIPLQARGMLRIIHSLTFPKFIDKEINLKKINQSIILLLFFGVAGVTTYILAAPFIFRILFPEYLDSIYMTQLFALSLFVYPSIYLMSGIMVAKNATPQIYKISIYGSIFNICTMLLLIISFGMLGVIYATIINSILTFLLFYIHLSRLSK